MSSDRIINGGRQYIWFAAEPPTTDPLEVSFDLGVTWHPLEPGTVTGGVWSADALGTYHAIVVSTPAATDNPVGAVVLPIAHNRTRTRLAANPEIIIEETGPIDVVP